ncbi:MAG: helicase C-terminal domain-containing protein [Caldisericum sp.]
MFRKIASILEKFIKKEDKNPENKLTNLLENLKNLDVKLREKQAEIINFLFHSSSKFKAVEAPTGVGKTLAYLIYALSSDYSHIIISTYTKSLQEQVQKELQRFFSQPSTIVKGKRNYICMDKADFLLSDKEKEFLKQNFIPQEILAKISVTSSYCRKGYKEICPFREQCEYLNTMENLSNEKIIIINHFLLPAILKKFQNQEVLLIVDECHALSLNRKVKFTEEDFILPEEPKQDNFNSVREYNLAYEKYQEKKQKHNLAQSLNISSPGVYEVPSSNLIDFSIPSEVIFISGTLPEKLPVEDVDIFYIEDKRSWSKVKFIVKNTNYKAVDYLSTLEETISYALQNYDKVLILATNYSQLNYIKKKFPEVMVANKEIKPFHAVEKLMSGEVKAIAGADVFWTGIDVPGHKCIIMTKLPFPTPDGNEEESFITGFQEMFKKFKQGFGRMLRTPECGGEIILLDNRFFDYPDLVQYVSDLEQKGLTMISEVPAEKRKRMLKVV